MQGYRQGRGGPAVGTHKTSNGSSVAIDHIKRKPGEKSSHDRRSKGVAGTYGIDDADRWRRAAVKHSTGIERRPAGSLGEGRRYALYEGVLRAGQVEAQPRHF